MFAVEQRLFSLRLVYGPLFDERLEGTVLDTPVLSDFYGFKIFVFDVVVDGSWCDFQYFRYFFYGVEFDGFHDSPPSNLVFALIMCSIVRELGLGNGCRINGNCGLCIE